MYQFKNDRLRHQDSIEEMRQKVNLTDQYEVAERRCIGDRSHLCEASRIAAISFSRSSIV